MNRPPTRPLLLKPCVSHSPNPWPPAHMEATRPAYQKGHTMNKLVTIGIPVYKRFTYLPQALQSVRRQDYPNLELIVSDNGMNGTKVPEFVNQWYDRPYRFRQNPSTVHPSAHYNQLLNEASGQYFIVLGDDDDYSQFRVDLVRLLDRYPQALVAVPRQETIDETGRTLASSATTVPEIMPGEDFIRAWCLYKYNFLTFSTVLMRTMDARRCGGFPVIPTANGDEDLLMIKLSLNNSVALSSQCAFRKREYATSLGYSCTYKELVKAGREFLKYVRSDQIIQDFGRNHPHEWRELNGLLEKLIWETGFYRWKNIYRYQLSPLKWALAAFSMPYIPAYYSAVMSTLTDASKNALLAGAQNNFPWAHKANRSAKKKLDS